MHGTLSSVQFMLLKQAPHFHIAKFSWQLGMDLCSLSLISIGFGLQLLSMSKNTPYAFSFHKWEACLG